MALLRVVADWQGYGYNVTELNGLLITLFQRYSELLLRKFSVDFDQVCLPTRVVRTLTDRSSRKMTTNP